MNKDKDSGGTSDNKARGKRRDRLHQATCADEPKPYAAYQRILRRAFALNHQSKDNDGKLVNVGKLIEMYQMLMQNEHLPRTLYQEIRTQFLLGEYFAGIDQQGLLEDYHEDQPPLAKAADHFLRAADIAYEVHDLPLYAQLKKRESDACVGVDPKQFQRAFQSICSSLKAWRDAGYRRIADDDHFEFALADAVGVRGQYVAEYITALDGLTRAAVLLQRLVERSDTNREQFANDSIYLDWDWAALALARGEPELAFRRILNLRLEGSNLFNPRNRARLARLIAVAAMDCAESGGIEGYSRKRLLSIADTEIRRAKSLVTEVTRTSSDEQAEALILLAEVRCLGMEKIAGSRDQLIEKAAQVAEKLDDAILRGQVELARGDNLRYLEQKASARQRYNKIIEDMTRIGFLELVSVAQRRLELMARKRVRKRLPPSTLKISPPSEDKILQN